MQSRESPEVTAYTDHAEHLVDELRRIDLMLLRHLEELRADDTGRLDGASGLYVSDAEVDALLRRDRRHPPPENRELRERLEVETRTIRDREAMTVRTGGSLRLLDLLDRFGLTDRQRDALLLGLAPEIDRKYERIYAYLQDDVTQRRPTVGLILRVLAESQQKRLSIRGLFSRSGTLVRSRLVRLSAPDETASLLSHRVTCDQRIAEFLLGADEVDSELSDFVEVVVPTAGIGELPLDEETRETISRTAPSPNSTPGLWYVHGPYGVGKAATVEAMVQGLGASLVRADTERLAGATVPDSLARLVREATLQDAAIHLQNVPPTSEEGSAATDGLLRELDRFEGHVFLTGEERVRLPRGLKGHTRSSVHLPRPGYRRRTELWAQRVESIPVDVDPGDLAAKFRLTRGQVDDAIATAHGLSNGDGLTRDAIYRGCRTQSSETLRSLARRTVPTYTWDDIVLPEGKFRQLREVAAHVKHRGTVYTDWGFQDRFSLGNGLNVLFSGPSGTGKTMAAEIIANDAGLDLFKIDLASVVSKYIGETEKNVKRIFDEAEQSNAILFFDEADALFGSRSEVSDSHDRYANIEVSYLLQRMEEHDG
ncbi:MAG: ATP-binding protein, partial [Halobacteriales archaeon]|nr:ATP-binding protein [Halobacteriales archaeon]